MRSGSPPNGSYRTRSDYLLQRPVGATAAGGAPLLCQFQPSGAELEEAPSRVAKVECIQASYPAGRLHRHRPGTTGRARGGLLQPAALQISGSKKGRLRQVDAPACRSFAANAVRLQLHALAYNLGNFMRTLAMSKAAEPLSLTSLREKLIKIGAKGHEPWPLRHVPDGRGRDAAADVPRYPNADRLAAGAARTSMTDCVQVPQTTTVEVRLDQAKATSSGTARRPTDCVGSPGRPSGPQLVASATHNGR
jgi:hypothetical protein